MKKPFKCGVDEFDNYCFDPCSYKAEEKVRIGSSWCKNICRCADDPTRKYINDTPNRDFNRTTESQNHLVMCHQILGRRKDGTVRMRINPNNKQSHEEN